MVASLTRVAFVLSVVVLLVGGYIFYTKTDLLSIFGLTQSMPVITFNQKTPLRVTVVSEVEDLRHGLSGRQSLDPTEGMLFIFPESDYHGIWMKDMQLSIDIAWVDERGVIVDMQENVTPDTYPRVFEPKMPARYVIETRAYFMDGFSIRVGDSVEIPKNLLPVELQN